MIGRFTMRGKRRQDKEMRWKKRRKSQVKKDPAKTEEYRQKRKEMMATLNPEAYAAKNATAALSAAAATASYSAAAGTVGTTGPAGTAAAVGEAKDLNAKDSKRWKGCEGGATRKIGCSREMSPRSKAEEGKKIEARPQQRLKKEARYAEKKAKADKAKADKAKANAGGTGTGTARSGRSVTGAIVVGGFTAVGRWV